MPESRWPPNEADGEVFLMTRFHRADVVGYADLVRTLDEELSGYGLRLTRADNRQYQDELWANTCYYMDRAQLGIAIFDCFAGLPPSLNASLELGYMLAKGKRCLLLRDRRLPSVQADLAGHLCYEIDPDNLAATISDRVRTWLRDLGIAKRSGERLVVFVSSGGTCRDPMAKIVLEQIAAENPPPFPLRVEARGLHPHDTSASAAARRTITEAYGRDMLRDHRPRRLTDRIIEEADLILVMSEYLRKTLPAEKTFVVNRYFGLPGEIPDPWPDGTDEQTLDRYRSTLAKIRTILGEHYPTLVERLSVEQRPATVRDRR